ncbi:MAG: hypothetical protein AB7K09_00775 [Planctomycetota bacterium]
MTFTLRIVALAVALAVLAPLTTACNSPQDQDADGVSDRPGRADQVWQSIEHDASAFVRYAFLPRVGPMQVMQLQQVQEESSAFRTARPNLNGAVRNLLNDMQPAIYYDELLGSPVAVLRGETIDEALQAGAAAGPGHVDVDHPVPRNSPRAITPPTVLVGSLVLFLDQRRVVALPVYRYRHEEGPVTASSVLFLAFEGRMGDTAWYRLGDVARTLVQIATRD